MPKIAPKKLTLTCPFCNQTNVVQSLPKEIDRELFHQEITIPAEPEPEVRRVAVLRITYEREYLCASCKAQWSKTFTTESQKHV
jgi:transposase-like protein